MQTLPAVPGFTITVFATSLPFAKLRFDAFGCVIPHGYTLTKPSAAGPVAVMFNTYRLSVRWHTAATSNREFRDRSRRTQTGSAEQAVDGRSSRSCIADEQVATPHSYCQPGSNRSHQQSGEWPQKS